MSPFAHALSTLRIRHELRQAELAEPMGVDQSYISALETGLKGPPTAEFVDKLCQVLELSEEEVRTIRAAANSSERKLMLPVDAPKEAYLFVEFLRTDLERMHPAEFEALLSVAKLRSVKSQPLPGRRLRRRTREGVPT